MSEPDKNGIVEEYQTRWYFADFWPGEYPPRFSVLQSGVVLMGRSEMKLTSPLNMKCPVPKRATYSPWNHKRNQEDNLKYRTVAKISTVTITNDTQVLATSQLDRVDVTLNLQKGDTLQFLIYHGEGFALYRYNGTNFVIDQADFNNKVAFEENLRPDDLWMQLPAAHGERCWILFSDAIKVDGIVETSIEGFGIANDIPDPAELSLKGVSFISGSAQITEESKEILDDLADKLWILQDIQFEVVGHTDSVGSQSSNQELSKLRAESVVAYLVNKGIDASRLSAKGYGESRPIADNNTADGRMMNRRVELRVL